MTSGILASRAARRRTIAFAVLVAISLLLMAFSNLAPIRDLQRAVGYAFRPVEVALNGAASSVSSVVDALGEIDRLRRDNEALRQENQKLTTENSRLDEIKKENEQLTGVLQTRNELDYETA